MSAINNENNKVRNTNDPSDQTSGEPNLEDYPENHHNRTHRDLHLEDVNKKQSEKGGIYGFLENLIRKYQAIAFVLITVPIIFSYIFCLAVAILPCVALIGKIYHMTLDASFLVQAISISLALGTSFFLFSITLLFVVPAINFLLPLKLDQFRGGWYSLPVIPWYIHNALTYLVRYTVLDLLTPSPLNVLFYKMMGMKVGKGVVINTTNISDPALITLDDYVTIGGSATLMSHYGMKGYLIIRRLHIKKKATIGLQAKIFGGVTIGENVAVAPNAVVLPKTHIPANTKFGYD